MRESLPQSPILIRLREALISLNACPSSQADPHVDSAIGHVRAAINLTESMMRIETNKQRVIK